MVERSAIVAAAAAAVAFLSPTSQASTSEGGKATGGRSLTVARLGTMAAAETALKCPMQLTVQGGGFAPDLCRFEIIVSGVECKNPDSCKPDYAITFKNTSASANDISSIVLFNLRKFEAGTYIFDHDKGLADFRGQLLDKGALARQLTRGTIDLDPRGDAVHVAVDVAFDGGISVQGSGILEVKQVFSP